MRRIDCNEVVGITGRSDDAAGRRVTDVMRAGGWGDGGKGQDEGLQHGQVSSRQCSKYQKGPTAFEISPRVVNFEGPMLMLPGNEKGSVG